MTSIILSAAILGGVGLTFGALIALANHRFKVFEDPRLDILTDLLPGTNCGACGCAGCRAFAEELVEGSIQPAGCTVMGPDDIETIAEYMGVDADPFHQEGDHRVVMVVEPNHSTQMG